MKSRVYWHPLLVFVQHAMKSCVTASDTSSAWIGACCLPVSVVSVMARVSVVVVSRLN